MSNLTAFSYIRPNLTRDTTEAFKRHAGNPISGSLLTANDCPDTSFGIFRNCVSGGRHGRIAVPFCFYLRGHLKGDPRGAVRVVVGAKRWADDDGRPWE